MQAETFSVEKFKEKKFKNPLPAAFMIAPQDLPTFKTKQGVKARAKQTSVCLVHLKSDRLQPLRSQRDQLSIWVSQKPIHDNFIFRDNFHICSLPQL